MNSNFAFHLTDGHVAQDMIQREVENGGSDERDRHVVEAPAGERIFSAQDGVKVVGIPATPGDPQSTRQSSAGWFRTDSTR